MFRKGLIMILALVIFTTGNTAFAFENSNASPIAPDQIIIGEPMSESITNDNLIFINVNINNTRIVDNPLSVSLVKVDRQLSFGNELGDGLNVSVMRLNSGAASMDKSTALSRVYANQQPTFSEGLVRETKIINHFFEIKDALAIKQSAYTELNKQYHFDLIADRLEELSKLDPSVYEDYKKWSTIRSELNTLRKSYSLAMIDYLSLFEKHIYNDTIKNMSFYKEIGYLSNGTYKLRFLNSEMRLVKEMTFRIIDKEKTIIPMVPLNITN
ncbi:MAG: hypothetical protein IBX70_03765 [Clostridia bacterium]|nr:hypothetical protein [Clostridia bacterium]